MFFKDVILCYMSSKYSPSKMLLKKVNSAFCFLAVSLNAPYFRLVKKKKKQMWISCRSINHNLASFIVSQSFRNKYFPENFASWYFQFIFFPQSTIHKHIKRLMTLLFIYVIILCLMLSILKVWYFLIFCYNKFVVAAISLLPLTIQTLTQTDTT